MTDNNESLTIYGHRANLLFKIIKVGYFSFFLFFFPGEGEGGVGGGAPRGLSERK